MAKTANEELFDALLRHQTYLMRYSVYLRNRMLSILASTEDDLAMRIRDKLRKNEGLSTPVEWQRLQSLLETIRAVRGEGWTQANDIFIQQATDLSYQEPIFMQGAIEAAAPVVISTTLPTARTLKAIAVSQPFEGRILSEWADTLEADDLRRIGNAIKTGMIAGESSEKIASRVIGTEAFKSKDGMTEITRRQVDAITRTAVSHISNASRAEFLNENAEVIEAEQFVATLDNRTTPVCRANDGKVFELNKGPRPPLHYSCRSLRIAALDGVRLGSRPAKPVSEKLFVQEYAKANGLGDINSRAALPRGTKADYDDWARNKVREVTGPIPASTTYEQWMRKQSKEFQDDTLGVTKAKLFRDGNLPLDRFINRNGDELSLSEMASRDAGAFRAAGLDPAKF